MLGNRRTSQSPSLTSGSASVTSGTGSRPTSSKANFQHHTHHPSSLSWTPATALSSIGSEIQPHVEDSGEVKAEKDSELEVQSNEVKEPTKAKSPSFLSWWRLQPRPSTASPAGAAGDAEKNTAKEERKLVLIGPVYAGLGAGLAACACLFYFWFSLISF